MDITELGVDDAAQADELFRLHQAVHAADLPDTPPPVWEPFLADLRQPNPETRTERLVARIDGELVASAALVLPDIDNRHLALMDLQVHPAYRRRGVGRALLDRVVPQAREQRRQALGSWTRRQVPGGPPRDEAGERFLTAMGFAPALAGLTRRIDLATIDEPAEQRLLDGCLPHATDYEWVGWTGLTPDELAEDSAELANRLNTDAPSGDVELEASTMDADRLHASERRALGRHSQLVGVAARRRSTGELAAITKIEVRSPGDHGSIMITIADPKHRGHRLGTIVKIECHRLGRRTFPALRYVYTGNAASNEPMAAINERLGFVVHDAGTLYQVML